MPGVLLLVLLPACLALPAPLRVQADADGTPAAPSRITRVVTFPQHAEVTRELVVDARAGENRAVFGDLVPNLNPHTLRASASPGARVTGTEINTVYIDEPITQEIAALDRAIQELRDGITLAEMSLARVQEQASFYRAVRERVAADMQAEFARGSVSVREWKDVLAFVDDGLRGCDERRAATALQVRGLETKLAGTLTQRQAYAGRQPKEKRQVTVAFAADAAGEARIQIHYMVDACTWKPSYDVHLDRAAQELEIVGYGQIAQWSGEAWDDVQLTLAMSRPNFELAVPELQPMVASLDDKALQQLAKEVSFLASSGREQASKWAETRFARRQERETFRRNLEQLARQSSDQLQQYGLSRTAIEGALSQLVDRFAAVRYDIDRRATIPLDGSPHKVVAFSARVPVKLRYVATPALGDSVMLQGEVVNSTDQPLIAGAAALFVDESYAGAASVPGTARNEGLSLGFGPDDALLVERRLVERVVQGPEAFRQSKVVTYRYVLSVRNFNDREVDVDVVDQIPVSKSEDIRVSFLESNHAQELDPDTGRLSWTLQVAAGATSEIVYAFSVECPVDREVHWQ